MTEFIVDVSDKDAELFIARFGLEGTTLMGYHLSDEIVRCRDCAYSGIFDGERYPGKKYKGMTYCINWGEGMQADWTDPDGYCHKAKRKEGGE